ncbi:unnamed protein product [Psylliodes chrysocephalus]|uniref:Uncharacterized protein n=1 Tax=Psylliodes chrysocephalus TaxID=3402493 RepID=A0A9P0D8P1_9CUCU|nr:unnamed protein product [Psylliodes chrysocephala]
MPAEWHHPNHVKAYYDAITSKLEDTCWNPPRPDSTKKLTYFNNVSEHTRAKEYDLYFAYTKKYPLWDQRKNKENRLFVPDVRENIFQQEINKPFPVVTSMTYGRPCRPAYDASDPLYRRVNAMGNFMRRRGVMRVKERMAT